MIGSGIPKCMKFVYWNYFKFHFKTSFDIFFSIFKKVLDIKRRLKVKFKIIPIYKLHTFWYTTSYHSPLLGTIQFGVLQKLCVGHEP